MSRRFDAIDDALVTGESSSTGWGNKPRPWAPLPIQRWSTTYAAGGSANHKLGVAGSEVHTPILIMRRQLVESVGGFEESFRGFYEDQAFLVKVYLEAPVFVLGQSLDRYRIHEDSCCAAVQKAGQYHSFRRSFLKWFRDYLIKQAVSDHEVWQALRNALQPYSESTPQLS